MDTKVFNPNRYIVNSIYKAACLEAENFDFEIEFCTYSTVVQNVKNKKVDVLILLDGSGLNSNFFEKISRYVPILVWTFDDPFDLENTLQSLEFVTRIYTNDCGSTQYYGEMSTYLPLAVDENMWAPRGAELGFRYDFSFIGTAWPNRIRTLSQMSSYLDDKTNFICLPSILGLSGDFQHELKNNFITSRIPVTQVREITSRSKVNLILGRDFTLSPSSPSISKGLQPRLFETILSGQKIWIDEITTQASSLFENRLYLEVPQELSDLETVTNGNLQSQMTRLKEQVLKKNTYRHRVIEIFKDVKKLRTTASKLSATDKVQKSKVKVLIVNNADYRTNISGGSFAFASDCENLLKELDFEVHSLYISNDRRSLVLQMDNSFSKIDLSHVRDFTQFNNDEVEKIFTEYLFQHNYSFVFFNHLIGLPLTLPSLAKAVGTNCVYVAHDWFLLCDIHNLHTNFAGYCGFLEKSTVDCDSCLSQQFNYKKGSKILRENNIKELVKYIDFLVVPSEFSKRTLSDKLKIEISKIVVIEPSVTPLVKLKNQSPTSLKHAFFFLGTFSEHKGIQRFIRLCHNLDQAKYDFYIFTNLTAHDFDLFKKDFKLDDINLIHHDNSKETRTNLETILSKYNLNFAYLCSEWPETFQITINELSNISDLLFIGKEGAPSQRIKGDLGGKVVTIYGESDNEIVDMMSNHTPRLLKNGENFFKNTFRSDFTSFVSKLNISFFPEKLNCNLNTLPATFTHKNLIEHTHFRDWENID